MECLIYNPFLMHCPYLTKCCQELNVPLLIINDQMICGGAHLDSESTVKDMEKKQWRLWLWKMLLLLSAESI